MFETKPKHLVNNNFCSKLNKEIFLLSKTMFFIQKRQSALYCYFRFHLSSPNFLLNLTPYFFYFHFLILKMTIEFQKELECLWARVVAYWIALDYWIWIMDISLRLRSKLWWHIYMKPILIFQSISSFNPNLREINSYEKKLPIHCLGPQIAGTNWKIFNHILYKIQIERGSVLYSINLEWSTLPFFAVILIDFITMILIQMTN